MKKLKKLPVGESSFENIRLSDFLYVDKTRHIFNAINKGKYYFLSRPRRFGKSLTISTLQCLFEGKKDLFKGLWIYENSDFEWKKHPVLLLDFNGVSHDTPENFKLSLRENLADIAGQNGIKLKYSLIKDQFKELIVSLYKKTGSQIVVLIDEYDKPLIDHLGKGDEALEIAKQNRDILKYFLGTLKGGEVTPALRFIFITGVSKFSQVSIFSDLNNLTDITMERKYADMLGYTHNELETCFHDYIKKLAKETGQSESETIDTLQEYYNGYRFSKRDVKIYNPFSILRVFYSLEFNNYWFETGTPTFLVNLLKQEDYNLPELEHIEIEENIFSVYELEDLVPEALLFQTGYLTIKNFDEYLFVLTYPNHEVKKSFIKYLFQSFACDMDKSARTKYTRLAKYLKNENFDDFFETVNSIFASISYTLKTEKNEAYFHTVFYLMVSASGMNVSSEVITSRGRIDLVVEFNEKIYIIEFKCNQSAKAGLKQIKEKGYADRYKKTGKKLILMGINFSSEKKNVEEWEIENITTA